MDVVTYGTRNGKDHSGAYLFMPDREAQTLLPPGSKPQITVTTGPLVSFECHAEVKVYLLPDERGGVRGWTSQSPTTPQQDIW